MMMLVELTIMVALLLAPTKGLESLLQQHGWGAVERTSRLDMVAADLAHTVGTSSNGLDPDAMGKHLVFTLARHGVLDAQVIPFTIRTKGKPDLTSHLLTLVSRLKRREPPTHYGRSTYSSSKGFTTTFILVHRGAESDGQPIRKARLGQQFAITGTLRRGYYRPRLIVHSPKGQFVERVDERHGRTFGYGFPFSHGRGTYGIELVADSQYGPVVLLRHAVHVGATVPKLPTVRLRPPTGDLKVIDPAERLLSRLNAHRVLYRLKPLASHPALTNIARMHVLEMHKVGALNHSSPDTGTLMTRVKKAGIKALFVAENLAEAGDERAAFDAFLESPGHARNQLIMELTHVGVAVHGRYFAVTMAQLPVGRSAQQ
jgi:uncharacterized protein YkwD